jgi:hypothetical protein
MGREARLRQSLPITNEGDLEAVRCAAECALYQLQPDLRVIECYSAWCTGRELPRLMRVRVSEFLPTQRDAAISLLIKAICRPPSEAEWTAVAQVVEAMGVPCWRWITSTLLKTVFPVRTYNAINPSDAKFIQLDRAGLVPGLPRGYIPRERGSAAIRRNVEWWYQRKIKHPPADLSKLAQKYNASVNRSDSSRSRVEEGIEQAENLLKRMLDENETP